MKIKALMATAVAGAMTLAMAGCSDSSGDSDAIKIGVVLSRTGPLSSIGVAELEGVEAAVDTINDAGGIDGKSIEIVVEDAQSTPQAAAAAATKLIQNERVVGLIGPEATALALAVAPIAQTREVPMVSTSSSFLGALEDRNLPYSFASSPGTGKIFAPMLKYWHEEGIEKIGVIGPKGDVLDGITAALEAIPEVELVGVEQFEPGQTDVTASMTKLASKDPEAIVVAGAAADGAAAQKAWSTLDIDSIIVQIGSNSNQAFIDLAGEQAFNERAVFAAFPTTVFDSLPENHPGREAAGEFVDVMTKKSEDFDPGSLAVLSWCAVYAFHDAIAAADSSEPDDIRAALEQTKMTDPLGTWARSSEDHDGSTSPFVIASYDDSGWHYVTD